MIFLSIGYSNMSYHTEMPLRLVKRPKLYDNNEEITSSVQIKSEAGKLCFDNF